MKDLIMTKNIHNPFQVTKAVDFSDQEINEYWVDFPIEGGFFTLANPKSPMPMFILGGKGSGKTHLMRYFSYNLQKLRYPDNHLDGIKKEGYVGIYLICSGLNAARFSRKGQDEEKWDTLFPFYLDLSFAQILLGILYDFLPIVPELKQNECELCEEIVNNIFDKYHFQFPKSIAELIADIKSIRKNLDNAINNCVITGELNVDILSSPGRLLFQIPKAIVKFVKWFEGITFLYLVDEIENLTMNQQQYINTLVREKEIPCSFKIGSRLYGIKTTLTYSAGEEIKEGSEYEKFELDSQFRMKNTKEKYKEFITDLSLLRLHGTGASINKGDALRALSSYFEMRKRDEYYDETEIIVKKYRNSERPYLKKLENNLQIGLKAKVVPGVDSETDINHILSLISYSDHPILEKLNTFLIYQEWYSNNNLTEAAPIIADLCDKFINDHSEKTSYHTAYKHWRDDLFAQLVRECDGKYIYYGIETLINMSHGLPRNFLIALKFIFKWSLFNDECPFGGEHKITIKSQNSGIREASEWFFNDARPIGKDGQKVHDSIGRLAHLFRECRFSDKPTEVSLITFSSDISKSSDEARRIIEIAEKWSLIIPIIGGHKDKNIKRIDLKYQLNGMLTPRWDLAKARRGTISLSPDEVNAIFDSQYSDNFESLLKRRVDRMTAPFFGKKKDLLKKDNKQSLLPGF